MEQSTIITEFTEDGKKKIVLEYIQAVFPNVEVFKSHRFIPMVHKLHNAMQLDVVEFGFAIQFAITMVLKFNTSENRIVEFAKEGVLLDKLFEKVQETQFFKDLMDQAEYIHLVQDPDTGEFVKPVIH